MNLDYQVQAVSDHIQSMDSPTHEIQYLITGENKALLVDTGSGYLSIKDVVRRHTDLPVEVVLTHGHPDHAFGIGGFETVYLNEQDRPLFAASADPVFEKQFIEQCLGRSVEADEVNPVPADFAFEPLQDGDVFDLGGVHVHVYIVPGHTQGSAVLLVKEDGVLITGDDANTNTWLFLPESTSVEEYRDNLMTLLEKTRGRYHRVFTTHRDVDTSPRLLEEAIALCNEVMAGNHQPVEVRYLNMPGLMAKAAHEDFTLDDGTCFNMTYAPDKVFRS